MSKPTAIHYQPPDYHEGHFACSVNWANGITNRWTDDPTKVKCGNCERTEVWRKAMHGTASFQEGPLKTHDPLHECIYQFSLEGGEVSTKPNPMRHITGIPVKHPHPLKGIILVDRVDGRLNMVRHIIAMGHSV